MAKVKAKNTVKMGGKTYLPNDEFEVKSKDELAYLLKVGAIEEVLISPEQAKKEAETLLKKQQAKEEQAKKEAEETKKK